jgi:predicted enzyme related to lactoylglutathione lyase
VQNDERRTTHRQDNPTITSMSRFFQLMLRTSDVAAARAFYASVLGPGELDVVQLHEQAVAKGARPHWLGFLDVDDVDQIMSAFVARGATRLSPTWVNPVGLQGATMRDPGGAVLALAKPPGSTHESGGAARSLPHVVWYLLHTADVERAKASYRELLGWEFQEPVELGGHGVFHPFAWEPGGAPVGSMSDISTRPGVHPHWLFQLHVDALDPAIDAVRAGGGVIVDTVTVPGSTARIAVCDDPQGAAFALRSPR